MFLNATNLSVSDHHPLQIPRINMPCKQAVLQSSLQVLVTDTSGIILTTLRDISCITNIPYLYNAAVLALGILNIIQVKMFQLSNG